MTNEELAAMTPAEREAAVLPATFKAAAACDRLTVQLMLAHQVCGEHPEQIQTTFTVPIASKEQPYRRRLRVGTTPMPLDFGWIKEPGYIVLENRTGGGAVVMPDEAEQARLANHRLIVLVAGLPIFEIPPGEAFMARLRTPEALAVVSNDGDASFNLLAVGR